MTETSDLNLDSDQRTLANDDHPIISLIEEQLQVEKKVVETSRVRVSKEIHEVTETIHLPIKQEHVSVNRVAINQLITGELPVSRTEGETLIIPVIHEITVVEKRLMLVEELRITRQVSERVESIDVSLRKESAVVIRTDPAQ